MRFTTDYEVRTDKPKPDFELSRGRPMTRVRFDELEFHTLLHVATTESLISYLIEIDVVDGEKKLRIWHAAGTQRDCFVGSLDNLGAMYATDGDDEGGLEVAKKTAFPYIKYRDDHLCLPDTNWLDGVRRITMLEPRASLWGRVKYFLK